MKHHLMAVFAAAILAFACLPSHAAGGEGDNTNCNGVGNPNSPCTGGGGSPGQGGHGGRGGRAVALAIAAQQQAQQQGQLQGQQQQANNRNRVDVLTTVNPTINGGPVNVAVTVPTQAPASGTGTEGTAKDAVSQKLADDLTVAPADPRRPVSTAYAPNVVATATCQGGASFGLQLDRVGVSAGGNNTVEFCETIEIAGVAYRGRDDKTGDEIMCGLKKYRDGRKRAGRPCAEDANGAKTTELVPLEMKRVSVNAEALAL